MLPHADKKFFPIGSLRNNVSLCQDMRSLLAFPQHLVKMRYSIEFRMSTWNWWTNYVVCISVPRYNGRITRKKCPNYFRVTRITKNDMIKCLRNVNCEETDIERSNDGFWLLRGIFKEYIKQNITMAVLNILLQLWFADW